MKKIPFLILPFLLTSCIEPYYYQLYKITADNGTIIKNKIVYEDDNCTVQYNLWEEGGNVGFSIFNKTESDLTVYLNKTFFVLNGVAQEYFQNRIFTISANRGSTVTSYNYPIYWNHNLAKVESENSIGTSTSYSEKPQVTIPSKTRITISEYRVSQTPYFECEFDEYPTPRNIKTLQFDISNSPFIFYNLITYSNTTDTLRFENNFHVSEITNYPKSLMFDKIDTTFCGEDLNVPIHFLKHSSPDKFYIKYD